jgi:16S rRNA (uracil1498-N3)-methyltransferase
VRITAVRVVAPASPAIEIATATPKGGRVDDLIDALSQLGAASWTPMRCERSVVEPGASKLDRLRRVAREASKQCGRAWLMRVESERTFDELARGEHATLVLVADQDGAAVMPAALAGAARVRVLVGPEGGFSPREHALMNELGLARVRLGPHVLRIEAAGAAACAWAQAMLDLTRRG